MRSTTILILFATMGIGGCILPQTVSTQSVSVSYQMFYDELSPYGTWTEYPGYGYVWIPNADPGFSPYGTSGHWVLTEDGWTWVSDYPWGWAAFHYGRWDYDNDYGWFWVPDDEWGPAWVSWRRSPGYYGWAPMRPGISISIAFGSNYRERDERWNFVRDRDITRSDIGSHYVDRTGNAAIINQSTVIVNTRKDGRRHATYMSGPNRDDVQTSTGGTVRPVTIRDAGSPGYRLSPDALQIYRPLVQKKTDAGQNPAPSRLMKLNEIRSGMQKNEEIRPQSSQPSAPPAKLQPMQPQDARSVDTRDQTRPRQTVSPPDKAQLPQPQVVTPPPGVQAPPPKNVQPVQKNQAPQNARPAARPPRPQPQKVAPSRQARESQPAHPTDTRQKEDKKRREEK